MTMRWSLIIFLLSVAPWARASEHPGNIYLAGQDVRITLPAGWAGWTVVDWDGKQLASGPAPNHVAGLGTLPIGYFELREKDSPGKISLGVVAESTPVETTPIALDTGMAWFYTDPQQIRDVCTLCKIAGVRWIRERSSWPEIETARGTWAPDGKYERAMRIEHEEGLKILQVNHIAPAWASKNATRFPEDLRDVYSFYRGVVQRWKGLADAIEPWNEPDIIEFGGHTGCEIASFQKAAYLGFKAGDPEFPVNEAVFAIDRKETIDEFGANEVYPYFDRYDLHHYIRLPEYPRAYARHRAVNGGRPMWTTEFNLTVWWADEKTHEPSNEELHFQAYRVGKVFAQALHEGTEKAFYFILSHYVERQLQYGLLHEDLTPRPAYVAFAAVGRLLNNAKPLGRVDWGNDQVKGYVFATQVDGQEKETLVAWSETKATVVDVPGAERAYDYLGRELANHSKFDLTRETVFVVLPAGGSKSLKLIAPPAKAPWREGKPSPVVLQFLGNADFKQSGFLLDKTKTLRILAYNFAEKVERGQLSVEGASGAAGAIELAPGAREERTVELSHPGQVSATLNLDDGSHAIVSARIVLPAATEPAK
jgi:hypothetical protein